MNETQAFIARALGVLAARLIYGVLGAAMGLLIGGILFRFIDDPNTMHLVFLVPAALCGLICAVFGDSLLGRWIWSFQDPTKDSYEGRGGGL